MPDGRYTYDPNVLCSRWTESIRDMFRPPEEDSTEPIPDSRELPLPILKSELNMAIKQIESNNAPGPDGVPADTIILLEYDSIQTLIEFFNCIYTSGKNVERMVRIYIHYSVKQKNKPNTCEIYRLTIQIHLNL